MIVRCPECSTGFKLPDDKITSKGVKLRCSKCSHVFRIRATDDGDTEIFYTDAEDGPPDSSPDDGDEAEEQEVDEDVGSTTQFGMPNVNKSPAGDAAEDDEDDQDDEDESRDEDIDEQPVDEAVASESAQPDYNPFPHAGDSIKPKKESRFDSSSADLDSADASSQDPQGDEVDAEEPSDEGLDLFDDEDDEAAEEDPFEGAFDESAPDAKVVKTTQAPGPAAATDDETDDEEASAPSGMSDESEAAQKQESATPEMDDVPVDDDSAFWSQQQESGFGSAEDMVDPSFGEDGAYFDPQTGKVDQHGPKTENEHEPGQPAQPASPSGSDKQQRARPSGRSAQSSQATDESITPDGEAQSKSAASANKKTRWEVEQPIEAHTVGGSGVQKTANFILILLVVIGLFFAVLAIMAGGFIDFKRLPHTLEVAFQGQDFQPREAWIPEQPPVKTAPVENPVRLQGVIGNVLGEGEEQMLAVRGFVKNVGDEPYEAVRVRAMLQDQNGRVVTEQEANVGARLSLDDIVAAENAKALQEMMPAESPILDSESSQPFTVVFPEIPARLRKSADLRYKVELASGDPVGASEGTE